MNGLNPCLSFSVVAKRVQYQNGTPGRTGQKWKTPTIKNYLKEVRDHDLKGKDTSRDGSG